MEAPQRQSTVLAWVGKTVPVVSRSSIGPVMIYGPFGLTSIVTSAIDNPPSDKIAFIDDFAPEENEPRRLWFVARSVGKASPLSHEQSVHDYPLSLDPSDLRRHSYVAFTAF